VCPKDQLISKPGRNFGWFWKEPKVSKGNGGEGRAVSAEREEQFGTDNRNFRLQAVSSNSELGEDLSGGWTTLIPACCRIFFNPSYKNLMPATETAPQEHRNQLCFYPFTLLP